MISKIFTGLAVFVLCASIVSCAFAASGREDAVAYKLAVIHIQSSDPEKILNETAVKPSAATVAEFQWILDTLSSRCINTQNDIATTMVNAWQLVKTRGYSMTLLDVARALMRNARNASLFGEGKVNFRMTSGLWTSTHKPKKTKK